MKKKQKIKPENTGAVECTDCPALCCGYVATQIDKPTSKRDYDHIRWYLMHRNVHVFIDHNGDWFIEFTTPCEMLDGNFKCTIYSKRPRICALHGETETLCEFHAVESPYRQRFSSAMEFERYLDERSIKWRWKKKHASK